MKTLPLGTAPSLHWLWIRLLIACGSARVAWILLWFLGSVRWLVQPARRRLVKQHYVRLAEIARESGHEGPLTQISPGTLTRRFFIHRAILGAAPALVSSAPPLFLDRFIRTDGIDAIAADRHGTVIAGTHFGALGITPAVLSGKGRRVLILRDQQFSPLVGTRHGQQFFLGAEPLFLNADDPASVSRVLLKCARALGEGAIIAYTADASHGNRYRECTLFGRSVQVRTALVEVAMRVGANASFGFSYIKDGYVCVEVFPPILLQNDANLDSWCHDFCKHWERLMIYHPEAISWHKRDLLLLTTPLEQKA